MPLSKRTAATDESCDEERKENLARGEGVLHILGHVGGAVCVVFQWKGSRSKAFRWRYSRCFVRPSNKLQSKIDDIFHTKSAWEVWWVVHLEVDAGPL